MNLAEEAGAAPGTSAIFRRILLNAGKLLGGRGVNALLSLGYLAIGARALGVDTFGVLVMINAFAQLLSDVVKFQSWQTVLQYGAQPLASGDREELQRVIRFTLVLDVVSSLLGVAIGVGAALLFAPLLGWGQAEAPLAAAYAVSVGFITAAAPIGVLRLLDRFDALAAQAVVVSIVRLAGAAVGFWMDAGLAFFLAVWAAGSLAGFLFVAAAAGWEMGRRKLLEGFRWIGPIRIRAAGVWRFAWATNVNATLSVAFTHLVTLMVGALLGPDDAALWRVARQIADAIAKPIRLISPALYPELAHLRASGREEVMWRLSAKIAVAGAACGLPLLAIAAFAGGPLLHLIMGAGFAAAAGILTWQVGAAVIELVALPLEPMVISLGQAGALVRVRIVVAAVFAAALAPLAERYGLHGAGAALTAASAVIAIGTLWLLLRRRAAPPQKSVPSQPAAPE